MHSEPPQKAVHSETALWPIIACYPNNIESVCSFAVQTNFGQKPFSFKFTQHCRPIAELWYRWQQFVSRIPAEIIDMILRHLTEDTQEPTDQFGRQHEGISDHGLFGLSMVCGRWYRLTRPSLFRNINVSKSSKLFSFVEMVCTSGGRSSHSSLFQPIGPYVNSTKLRAQASERVDLLLLSPAPPKLQRLSTFLWDGDGTSFDRQFAKSPPCHVPPRVYSILPTLFQGFAAITIFVLQRHTFSSFRRMAQLVSSLPNLVTLRLEDVVWPFHRTTTLPTWPCHPASLRQVTLDLSESMRDIEGGQSGSLLWLFIGKSKFSFGKPSNPYSLGQDDATILTTILASEHDLNSMFMSMELSDRNDDICKCCTFRRFRSHSQNAFKGF